MGDAQILQQLAAGILMAGSTAGGLTEESAGVMAREVWAELQAMGTDAFPCLVQRDDLRFVYQWDEHPPVLTVMLWDEGMWRDMARIEVSSGK